MSESAPSRRSNSDITGLLVLAGIVVVFILGHIWGYWLFDNNWSLTHWQYLPAWYVVSWSIALVGLGWVSVRYHQTLDRAHLSNRSLFIAGIVATLLLVLFQFDSFVFGGGNLKVAQLSQREFHIHRWYEFGASQILSALYRMLESLLATFVDMSSAGLKNFAAVSSYKLVSFGSALASMVIVWSIAGLISTTVRQRVLAFVVCFFSSVTLLYFGFVGLETALVPVAWLTALLGLRLLHRFTVSDLLILWFSVGIGVVLHMTGVYLIPAALFVSVVSVVRFRGVRWLGLGLSVGMVVVLILGVYYLARNDLEVARALLFWHGKNPHSDYGLLSLRHLGDMLQIGLLTLPEVLLMPYLIFKSRRTGLPVDRILFSLILGISGAAIMIFRDPTNSVVLDFPLLISTLAPRSLVVALLLLHFDRKSTGSGRLLPATAAVCALLPFGYIPAYSRISYAENYVASYLDQHNAFYRTASLAFRDAWFYNGNMAAAGKWEAEMPIKSPEYLNMRGVSDLISHDKVDDALAVLFQIKASHPFWSKPRAMIAVAQMTKGRHSLAKPEIDTCLMLEPFNRDHRINLYNYYRDLGQYVSALETIDQTLALFPHDLAIRSDRLLVLFRMGDATSAGELADLLTNENADLPIPHLVKGLLMAQTGNSSQAVRELERFLAIAPDHTDAPRVREIIEQLGNLGQGN